jgi:hypothetical protein
VQVSERSDRGLQGIVVASTLGRTKTQLWRIGRFGDDGRRKQGACTLFGAVDSIS